MKPPAPPEIVIHNLEQARAVLAISDAIKRDVQLRSDLDAAAYAGVGYLHGLSEALGHELLVDCHDDAGLVMAALRTGCRKITFSGRPDIHKRLAEMADQQGAEVRFEPEHPEHCLLLSPEDDDERIRQWLDRYSGG